MQEQQDTLKSTEDKQKQDFKLKKQKMEDNYKDMLEQEERILKARYEESLETSKKF